MACRQGQWVCQNSIKFDRHNCVLVFLVVSTFFKVIIWESYCTFVSIGLKWKILNSFFIFLSLLQESYSFVFTSIAWQTWVKQETEQLKTTLEREILKIEVISCNSFLPSSRIVGNSTLFFTLSSVKSIFYFLFFIFLPRQLYYKQCTHNSWNLGLLFSGRLGQLLDHHLLIVSLIKRLSNVNLIIWKYLMMGLMYGKLILSTWSLETKLHLGHTAICKFILIHLFLCFLFLATHLLIAL